MNIHAVLWLCVFNIGYMTRNFIEIPLITNCPTKSFKNLICFPADTVLGSQLPFQDWIPEDCLQNQNQNQNNLLIPVGKLWCYSCTPVQRTQIWNLSHLEIRMIHSGNGLFCSWRHTQSTAWHCFSCVNTPCAVARGFTLPELVLDWCHLWTNEEKHEDITKKA